MRQNILITLVLVLTVSTPVLAQQQASLLAYQVYEQGVDPYFSRILVTPGFLRMDEGGEDGDFTLFDRKAGVIYNVSNEDHSILVIDNKEPLPTQPADLKISAKSELDSQAPMIGDKQPQNVRIYANDELCVELVTLPDTMVPALDALREFRLVLARVQAAALPAMPEDAKTPCDLAQHIFAPGRIYDFGLPVQESREGQSQSLVDFSPTVSVDDKLFVLPAKYEQIGMPGAIQGTE